jgi:hypothetical protein
VTSNRIDVPVKSRTRPTSSSWAQKRDQSFSKEVPQKFRKLKKERPAVGRFVIPEARFFSFFLSEGVFVLSSRGTPYWTLSRGSALLAPDASVRVGPALVLDLSEFRRANGSLTTATHET